MLEKAIFTRLSTDAGITALAGNRIYPQILPQNPTLPAITYFRVSTTKPYAQSNSVNIAQARLQISCWAETYSVMKSLVEAVRKSLDGFSGVVNGIQITSYLNTCYDLYDDDTGIYHGIVDFKIFYEEAI